MPNYEDKYGIEKAAKIKAKLRASAKKRWEKLEEKEKASKGQLKRFSDPAEIEKLIAVQNRSDVIEKKRVANIGKECLLETRLKLRYFNLGRKHSEETRAKISSANCGENHPLWKGGVTGYPSVFNHSLRESIRERDGYVCRQCNKSQEDNGRKLDVHHIDYDKENNDPINLISLCWNCHMKTNSVNREHFTEMFTEMQLCFKKHLSI
jgi:hypothetical protein